MNVAELLHDSFDALFGTRRGIPADAPRARAFPAERHFDDLLWLCSVQFRYHADTGTISVWDMAEPCLDEDGVQWPHTEQPLDWWDVNVPKDPKSAWAVGGAQWCNDYLRQIREFVDWTLTRARASAR